MARRGLSHVFARPFEKFAARDEGLDLRLSHRLEGIEVEAGRARVLKFADGDLVLDERSCVIFALPAWSARALVPALSAPDDFMPIVNVHFRLPPGAMAQDVPLLLGVLGGVSQWIFTRADVASVTISAARHLARQGKEEIARSIWPEVVRALELDEEPMPVVRVIKEQRATFAATAANLARRPPQVTGLANLWLAGDWVNTALPATIEGAVRSGEHAARLALTGAG